MSNALHTETEHLGQLGFARLLAGETQGTDALRAHLDACERCQARYQALAAEQRALMTDAHVNARVDALMAALEARAAQESAAQRPHEAAAPWYIRVGRLRWLRRWQVWTPVAAAAAIALLALWPPDPGSGPGPDPGRTRSGGVTNAPALQVMVVASGDAGRLLEPGQILARGTPLGFRGGCERHCSVLLAAIGETGPARIIEHAEPAPWQLVPGQWTQLPAGLGLDGSVRVAALFCASAPARTVLGDLLARHYAAAPGQPRDLAGPPPPAPAGCVLRSVLVRAR